MREVVYELLGAACGLGAGRPDTARASAYLRESGILDRLRALGPTVLDGGDVQSAPYPAAISEGKIRHAKEILSFGSEFYAKILESYSKGRFPIIVGGDHSISIASISAAKKALEDKQGPEAELGLVWVDAHSDLNTPETSPSGNVHGMSVAALLGHGEKDLVSLGGFAPKVKPENVLFIGLRDLDPAEKVFIRENEMLAYTMKDIDVMGIGAVVKSAFQYISERTDGFVVSFDLDVVDPRYAPGVGTPVRGGLTLRESHLIMEMAAETEGLMSVEMVELNPLVDPEGVTGELAIGLIESAVGKSIL